MNMAVIVTETMLSAMKARLRSTRATSARALITILPRPKLNTQKMQGTIVLGVLRMVWKAVERCIVVLLRLRPGDSSWVEVEVAIEAVLSINLIRVTRLAGLDKVSSRVAMPVVATTAIETIQPIQRATG